MPVRPSPGRLRAALLALALAVGAGSTASAQAPRAGAISATQAATAYTIDPAASSLTYDMRHPTHTWTGTSRSVSGRLLVVGAGAGRTVTGGSVSAPVASFDSRNRNRDSNMLEATEAARFRTVTFQAVRVTPLAAPTAAANVTVEGVLTFHGVRQAVRTPALAEVTDSGVRLTGQVALTLTQFRIDPPSLLGVPCRDYLGLTFVLVARPS